MKFTKILGITAALVSLGLGSAYAADEAAAPDTQKSQRMMKVDTNQDGKVSYDEFRAANEKRMEARFKKLDANNDGFIDQDERQAARKAWGEKRKVKGDRGHKFRRGGDRNGAEKQAL